MNEELRLKSKVAIECKANSLERESEYSIEGPTGRMNDAG